MFEANVPIPFYKKTLHVTARRDPTPIAPISLIVRGPKDGLAYLGYIDVATAHAIAAALIAASDWIEKKHEH